MGSGSGVSFLLDYLRCWVSSWSSCSYSYPMTGPISCRVVLTNYRAYLLCLFISTFQSLRSFNRGVVFTYLRESTSYQSLRKVLTAPFLGGGMRRQRGLQLESR